MFSDPVSFNGDTRFEVIAVLANCGMDTDRARRALVTWIRHKQYKGRSTEHILAKLRDIESKFIRDSSLHSAFRDARAETFLPRLLDLPLPPHIRRASEGRIPESAPPLMISTPIIAGPSAASSLTRPPSALSQQTSSSVSPLRLSQASSQILETPSRTPSLGRRISLPQNISRVLQSRSPRIKIPRDRSRPSADSPITSSPEESGLHSQYHYMSDPIEPSSHFHGSPTPPSTSPPELPRSPLSPGRKNRPPSQRHFTNSVGTSSSEDSVFHPEYRHMAMSSSLRRVTLPRTSPPDVPLPPIPQDMASGHGTPKGVLPGAEQPLTPLYSPSVYSSTPARPLPMQPIPSPVPSLDDAEHMSTIDVDSTRQYWVDSNSERLPSEDVVRQDSPVFMFHDNRTISSAISDLLPYADQPDPPLPLDVPKLGESLDKALNMCGGSPQVRLEVVKCVGFERGYEPPYWQARLLAAGLDADRAKRLVDEMCKQVDWSTSFGRAM